MTLLCQQLLHYNWSEEPDAVENQEKRRRREGGEEKEKEKRMRRRRRSRNEYFSHFILEGRFRERLLLIFWRENISGANSDSWIGTSLVRTFSLTHQILHVMYREKREETKHTFLSGEEPETSFIFSRHPLVLFLGGPLWVIHSLEIHLQPQP